MAPLNNVRRLSVLLTALMAAQALLGIFLSGEYRDVAWIAATWWGNDLVTLFVVVPLLVVALVLSARGSSRGTLLWIGTLAYAVYNYAYYLLGAELNRFFLIYVACVLIAATNLVMAFVRIKPSDLAARFRRTTPVRLLGGYFMFVAVGLSVIWIGMWAAYAFAGRPTPVATEAFKLVAALDLTLIVPVLAVGGYLLFRRRAWGYVVAGFGGVQATLYLLVLTVNSAVAIQRGLAEAPGELPIWGMLLATTAAATLMLLAKADGELHPALVKGPYLGGDVSESRSAATKTNALPLSADFR